jgi:pimeloyl-ACP methyl ester carboxylesterase
VTRLIHRLIAAAAACSLASCAQYSSVYERGPAYHYRPGTQVGALIAKGLDASRIKPEVALGCYLDAAACAANRLRSDPGDDSARHDYNFAVSRLFDVIRVARLEPWTAPITVPGADGAWQFSAPAGNGPQYNPANYVILPADRYRFGGEYIRQHSGRDGLGAPLIVVSRPGLDYTTIDSLASGKSISYGMTAVLRFQGRRASISFEDPLAQESVQFAGHRFPLAADFSAPLAMALAQEHPEWFALASLFLPQRYAQTARIAHLQPYDPSKVPVIFIHGLLDSSATWTPMINALRADPVIRRRYQFLIYSYPSGYPYPYSAAIMRKQLDLFDARYPGHRKFILIGHSMGGCIARTMITDSGMTLWNAYFKRPPAKLAVSPDARQFLTDLLIFRHRNDVGRVIFISTPHRGSDLARTWVVRVVSGLVESPITLVRIVQQVRSFASQDSKDLILRRIPNSVDTLAPNDRFVRVMNTIPLTAGIPYNSIMGDRGRGGNLNHIAPVSSDGVVPYWSSHLDGAQSELIVPSNHMAHQNPQAIREVDRILDQSGS